jgi:glucoamylase
VLHSQDGYSGDQARSFAPTPQPYQFGLCRPGTTSPICARDPGTAPKVIDTVAPPDVDQYAELDPTAGPVRLHGVRVS